MLLLLLLAGIRGGGGMQNKHVFNYRQDETKGQVKAWSHSKHKYCKGY